MSPDAGDMVLALLVNKFKTENKLLREAIEKHREQTGNNMCWENDEELWKVLDDGVKLDHTPPPWPEFISKCAQYRASRK